MITSRFGSIPERFACWLASLALAMTFLALSDLGQEGFEPPTRGFGDRCSTVGATGLDLSFPMRSVFSAARAELAQLQLVLLLLPVLRGCVVPLLAQRALERNDASVTCGDITSLLTEKRGKPHLGSPLETNFSTKASGNDFGD